MTTPPRRRLDTELVARGLADSRSRAAALIAEGRVEVDGVVVTRAGVEVGGRAILVSARVDGPDLASRGGYKLAGALSEWPALRVAGRRALDVGASTGGFTDVLLARGAREVVALDVGAGQLVDRLRADGRVRVVDRCNARRVSPELIGGPVELAVCDLSFISLRLVLDAVISCLRPDGDLVPMVKPQFEVGRAALGRGGVVRDPRLRAESVAAVAEHAARAGWGARGVVASALPGPAGNVEYFLWLRSGPATVSAADIRSKIVVDGADPANDVVEDQ